MLTGKELFSHTFALGDLAANNDAYVNFLIDLPDGYTFQISNAIIASNAAVSKQASNIANITVKDGAGTCLLFYSNNNTGGYALAAGEPIDMTVIKTACTVAGGTTLKAHHEKAASGTAITQCVMQMDIVPILAP